MEKPRKITYIGAMQCVISFIVAICVIRVQCDDKSPIPADRKAVNSWFQQNLKSTQHTTVLSKAEKSRKVIKVGPGGQFKTITEAVKSIPAGNKQRVVINIAKGTYNEKIKIERTKPFVTFYGETGATIVSSGTAEKYGTYDSATVDVQGDYFIAYNIIFKNAAPRPTKKDAGEQTAAGAQAVAFRIGGDMSAFYSCKFYGYQDTLLDEKGRHLFKDCYIEGTIDFIFGGGKSLYLLCDINIAKQEWTTVITAQGKREKFDDSGFAFVHCSIKGETPKQTHLGRAWQKWADVAFLYCSMDNSINPVGWDAFGKPLQFSFSEYQNTGPGADLKGRAPFTKKIDAAGAKQYLNLGYIEASKWLLPPTEGGSTAAVGLQDEKIVATPEIEAKEDKEL